MSIKFQGMPQTATNHEAVQKEENKIVVSPPGFFLDSPSFKENDWPKAKAELAALWRWEDEGGQIENPIAEGVASNSRDYPINHERSPDNASV